jgi:hypothetical protein
MGKSKFNNGNRNGYKIEAELIRETKICSFLGLRGRGSETWFPKSKVNFDPVKNKSKSLLLLMKEKFPNKIL